MRIRHWLAVLITVLVSSSGHADDNRGKVLKVSPLTESGCPIPCDAPGYPEIGLKALKVAKKDAYKAVDILLPLAESSDLDAQISIAFVIRNWLSGNLPGRSTHPFTWRECWVWWHLAAYQNAYMAGLLGGAYSGGLDGLAKNEALGECLGVRDPRPTRERVKDCFMRYGSKNPIWE